MNKLGITGGMGSGKSTAASFFQKKGAVLFNADEEAKNHLQSTISLQHRIVDIFGSQVTTQNRLNLKKMAKVIFSDVKNQKILNGIIWPEVYLLMTKAAESAENKNSPIFVVDAALLFEAGYTEYFDSILLITASKSIRIQRIRMRKNIPEDQIEKRMALQMPESEKQKLAQATIENNEDMQDLFVKLEEFYRNINVG